MENVNKRFSVMKQNSPKIENLINYIKEWLEKSDGGTVSIGTDSQQRGKNIVYATVIVLKFPFSRGCHVLYTKDYEEKNIKGFSSDSDIFIRLSGEALRSIEIANFLSENGIKVHTIELDYQKDLKTKSTSSFQANSGWIKSLGYEVLGKDQINVLSAVRAADSLVKPKSHRKRKKVA